MISCGVPRQLVPDNLKTGAKKADNYAPLLNKTYLEMAEHYGCAIVPVRSRKPYGKSIFTTPLPQNTIITIIC
jgi:transposase